METTTVGEIAGGERFSVYSDQFLKIDRANAECVYIGYDRKEPHGYAVNLANGIVVQFPVATRCVRPDDGASVSSSSSTAG